MHRLLAAVQRNDLDLEAWETLILQAARNGGAGALATLLKAWRPPRGTQVCGRCGQLMKSRGRRTKQLLTLLGKIPFSRSGYRCLQCHDWSFPADQVLQIENTMYSPGVRRLMARAGGNTDFQQAAADLDCYAGIVVEPREIERIAESVGRQIEAWLGRCQSPEAVAAVIPKFYVSFDGTGIPMRRSELAGRKGRQTDGTSRTREVKLGCVFTQIGVDAKGHPQREADSTTYVGAIETSTCFGWRIFAEAQRRGLAQAQLVIVLTDGARYNRTIAQTHFPKAIHIVDLYHAYEHLNQVAQLLWGSEAKTPKKWKRLLKAGKIADLLTHVQRQVKGLPSRQASLQKSLAYFRTNKDHMRYGDYRRKKLFVGSGVVEAGCRTVIGQRLKHSGMRWSLRGANAIIALRCCLLSRKFEDFWAAASS